MDCVRKHAVSLALVTGAIAPLWVSTSGSTVIRPELRKSLVVLNACIGDLAQVRHLSGPRLESVAQTRLVCSTNSSGY
jgi:hypothetical protein